MRHTTPRCSVASRTRSSRSTRASTVPPPAVTVSDPARPPDNLVGRYIGLAPAFHVGYTAGVSNDDRPFAYLEGNEGTVTIHARVNTFSDETVTGPEGWPYEGRTVRRPNKDGLLEVFLDGRARLPGDQRRLRPSSGAGCSVLHHRRRWRGGRPVRGRRRNLHGQRRALRRALRQLAGCCELG